jgi:hypothetical protein
MVELQSGTQIRHASLGQGKVVAADAQALHVFFPDNHTRFATKLRLPEARRFLRLDGFEPDNWLGGLSAFEFDPTSGRWALAASWLTQEEAVALYVARKPKAPPRGDPGEAGPGVPDRRARWALATERWRSSLGTEVLGRLIEEGEIAAAVRRIVTLEKLLAPLLGKADQGVLAEALSDIPTASRFLRALLPALDAPAPGRARFEELFRATLDLPGPPERRWLVATLLPFVAAPDRHVLLRPRSTGHALERLGTALTPGEFPAWTAYAALRAASVRLLAGLAPHGAKDFADVECFLHFTAAAKAPARGQPLPARRAAAGATARSRS